MHIFVERHSLDISDALATDTQNFSRNVVTERRREISRRGREIFMLSERILSVLSVKATFKHISKQKSCSQCDALSTAFHFLTQCFSTFSSDIEY